MNSTVDEMIQERLDFIQKHIAQGNTVGYYVGRRFRPIKLEELVSFDNAVVIGTCWEDYIPITDEILYAFNGKGTPVAALLVPEKLRKAIELTKHGKIKDLIKEGLHCVY